MAMESSPTESGATAAASQSDIAPDGDIILVVGSSSKKIRVCSILLKNASPYFRNLLGPHFAEGQDVKCDNPKEVLMPVDNAEALEMICNIIHLCNDAVPLCLPAKKVFEIAVTAEKFDCVVALKLASAHWLTSTDVESLTDLAYLMAAAYVMDDAAAFSEITFSMVLRHCGSYLILAEPGDDLVDYISWQTCCKYR